MSTEDYKRGVEDALALPFKFVGTYTAEFLKETLDNQRKKLLTKKVTKWVNLWGKTGFIDTGQTALYASKEDARKVVSILERPNFIGTYPIEIDQPL